ncbi:hypothetical protein WN66_05312 [Saccharomyces cerevisiae]|uniref:Putative uncharacterized protein YNL226W n=2 Tax=Saccharomyces cerevisiae TaxID=4932 RepID=YNW6_YEAST|nr:RecName: Full=Putative uncharacterized protein YNL226W [Saccharomyces cerevisiae S288C]KZV08397.1 hypothetical protein WN66_05312 [Saccharomyces cerevisiae]CAA93372.1 N1259 [Saccharomyces cerevisiae]CAA96133.1 unnamed protein product [Saccharomyces cerevisiae]CAY82381.1 EC1118_1N9_1178p [Saccharomyces cerevisiae EC1118]
MLFPGGQTVLHKRLESQQIFVWLLQHYLGFYLGDIVGPFYGKLFLTQDQKHAFRPLKAHSSRSSSVIFEVVGYHYTDINSWLVRLLLCKKSYFAMTSNFFHVYFFSILKTRKSVNIKCWPLKPSNFTTNEYFIHTS